MAKQKLSNLNVKSLPSAIVAEQLEALIWARKQKDIEIDMNYWACNVDGTCRLCEAGAWYAKRYGLEDALDRFDAKDEHPTTLMEAMDSFRIGNLSYAYSILDRVLPTLIPERFGMREYEDHPEEHIEDLRSLRNFLRKNGE